MEYKNKNIIAVMPELKTKTIQKHINKKMDEITYNNIIFNYLQSYFINFSKWSVKKFASD